MGFKIEEVGSSLRSQRAQTTQERFSLIPPTCASPVQYVNKMLASHTNSPPNLSPQKGETSQVL